MSDCWLQDHFKGYIKLNVFSLNFLKSALFENLRHNNTVKLPKIASFFRSLAHCDLWQTSSRSKWSDPSLSTSRNNYILSFVSEIYLAHKSDQKKIDCIYFLTDHMSNIISSFQVRTSEQGAQKNSQTWNIYRWWYYSNNKYFLKMK